MGILNVATYVTVDGQYVNVLEMNQYQNKIRFLQLTGTSGTLTSQEINLLRSDNTNYIIVDNELYNCNDLQDANGYLVYTHTCADTSNNVNVKTLSITLNNNSWSIQTTPVQPKIPVANTNEAVQFAEDERQKSKNLIPFPYYDGNSMTTNGITFTVNNNQSVSIVGSIDNHDSNAVMYLAWDMPLKAGTYGIFNDSSNADIGVIVWIGDFYYSGEFTLSSDTTAKIYLQVSKYSTQNFNTTVKFMLCEGGIDTDWQPYNGSIVHEKEIEITTGVATLNTNFVSSGEVSWVKQGKLVVVSFSDIKFNGSIAHQNLYFSGLPKKAIKDQTFLLYQKNAHGGSSTRCMMQKDSTQIINWYDDVTLNTEDQYYGQFTYITDEN